MKKIILLILILAFELEDCIKVTDFCYKLENEEKAFKCHGNYSLSCCDVLCTKDVYSCQSLRLFSVTKNFQRTPQDYVKLKNRFDTFLSLIQRCTEPPKLNWTLNDVCSIKKDCTMKHSFGHWMKFSRFSFIPIECKCSQKYKYECNKHHQCAVDKDACELFNNKSIVTKECYNKD